MPDLCFRMPASRAAVALVIALCGASIAVTSLASPQNEAPIEAPAATEARARVTVLEKGLEHPWSLAFLPDGGMLITERAGRLRYRDAQGRLSTPLAGVPQVYAHGQGGLLDVVLSPDFREDRLVYLSYAEADDTGKAGTTVGRGRLADDSASLDDFQTI